MLSPKMQRSVRVNEAQLLMLSDRAQYDHSMIPNNVRLTTLSKQHGYLHKRTSDSNKWQLRWFILYQNLLFYYENEASQRPSGIIFLEGCYCDRFLSAPSCINSLTSTSGQGSKVSKEDKLQHCFCISFRRENQRQYELRANTESECSAWISAIREASFNKLLLQKEELEQKHVHLLQVVESEKTAKWQYTQHCEELASEIKKLRAEICALRKECKSSVSSTPARRESFAIVCDPPPTDETTNLQGLCEEVQDSVELRKIKKVQSFFRGWLCRRRWKQIVEEYIKSPHAESMRKRNHLVFSMVEAEEEYMEQLEILVSCFLRPFRMAASSKRPPCTHEDVNSIFLNSETVLFLHQIFLKGLTSRLESWPTLVLGDLFDMLLPMLSIYQEYVRNHHYSLQVLTECKSNPNFATVLKRLEAKPSCQGRSLETFLTYPMHQIPRYIITLHELLAHTPHDHVERKSLQNARQQLEDLSRQMHDEVSETENLRKNLSVERMIVEGCDILLDVNQVFVRQGSLVQVPPGKGRIRSRLASFKSDREQVRQCFLFSNHLIIATRTSGGRLHLVADVGKIALADATLIEDPSDSEKEDDGNNGSSCLSVNDSVNNNPTSHRDFKILVDTKSGARNCIHLIAATVQDKEAWISDISQCLDNIHLHSMFSPGLIGSSGGSMVHQHALRADPRLFKDDVDIRFSRTLNSCKLPQVRYATPERLLQRLTDLRFLSIDFLNTFLLTYRVFTDGETVLNALKRVFYDPPIDQQCDCDHQVDYLDIPGSFDGGYSLRRTSGASSVSGYCSEGADRDRSCSTDSSFMRVRYRKLVHQQMGHHAHSEIDHLTWIPEQASHSNNLIQVHHQNSAESKAKNIDNLQGLTVTSPKESSNGKTAIGGEGLLNVPLIATSGSSDTLTENTLSGPSSPSNLSSHTLVGSTGSGGHDNKNDDISPSTDDKQRQHFKYTHAPTSPLPERINPNATISGKQQRSITSTGTVSTSISSSTVKISEKENTLTTIKTSPTKSTATHTIMMPSILTSTSSSTNKTNRKSSTDSNNILLCNVPTQLNPNQQQIKQQHQQQQQPSSVLHPQKIPPKPPHRQSLPTVTTTLCCENQETGKIPLPLSPPTKSTGSGGSGAKSAVNVGTSMQGKDSFFSSTSSVSGGTGIGGAVNGGRDVSLSSNLIITNHPNEVAATPSLTSTATTTTTTTTTLLNSNKTQQQLHQQSHHQGLTSISPPKMNLLIDRRPSVGANVIPHAALCQHRHSLQINGDGGVYRNVQGIDRAGSPRVSHRVIKTPEKPKKNSFCSQQPPRRFSESDDEMSSSIYTTPRGSLGGTSLGTISSRASMQHDPGTHCPSKIGVVITSYRQSHRRSSTSTAAAAFAIATSASSNPRDEPPEIEAKNRKDSVVSSPATMRVLNVLRHWVSKHFQDFEQDAVLRSQAIAFLDDITCSPNLLPSEHRAASQLLRLLCRDDLDSNVHKLDIILTPPTISSKESIETLSALEIAEQMTYLDHQIFLAIRSEEFLGQAWMKADKKERAEHIILMTKRFNDGSRLVSSEIISRTNMSSRVAAIEKWTAVADICRCLHNFNGVLQICAAFTNAAVYRLKKTWDKVPKTIKQTITKLQAVVCSDGRFRAMREALHRCDPPCIPYLGMYLTDLSFIEEGTPDFTPDGLLNFSKMRMIAHVIREIRHFQQTPYKIDHIPKVTGYLLDTSLLLDDDELYSRSLQIEPRSSRLSAPNTQAV